MMSRKRMVRGQVTFASLLSDYVIPSRARDVQGMQAEIDKHMLAATCLIITPEKLVGLEIAMF